MAERGAVCGGLVRRQRAPAAGRSRAQPTRPVPPACASPPHSSLPPVVQAPAVVATLASLREPLTPAVPCAQNGCCPSIPSRRSLSPPLSPGGSPPSRPSSMPQQVGRRRWRRGGRAAGGGGSLPRPTAEGGVGRRRARPVRPCPPAPPPSAAAPPKPNGDWARGRQRSTGAGLCFCDIATTMPPPPVRPSPARRMRAGLLLLALLGCASLASAARLFQRRDESALRSSRRLLAGGDASGERRCCCCPVRCPWGLTSQPAQPPPSTQHWSWGWPAYPHHHPSHGRVGCARRRSRLTPPRPSAPHPPCRLLRVLWLPAHLQLWLLQLLQLLHPQALRLLWCLRLHLVWLRSPPHEHRVPHQ